MYTQKKKGITWAVTSLIMFVIISTLAGCSAANENRTNSKAESVAYRSSESKLGVTNVTSSEQLLADEESESENTAAATAARTGIATGTGSGDAAFNQKIIYNADLSMKVDELEASATKLRHAIQQSGGYILQFQDTRYDGKIGSSYTIKVPADGFMSFIDRIQMIEHREFSQNIKGKDVSEEYVDLESRMKARHLVESRLLVMMDTAVKADDLLKFSEQLSEVQLEIERIKGKIRYLDNNVSFATVELRMVQTNQAIAEGKDGKPALGGRMSEALTGSTKVVWDGLKLMLVILAGALPVAALLAVIAIPVVWIKRRQANTAYQIKPIPNIKTEPEEEQQPPTV